MVVEDARPPAPGDVLRQHDERDRRRLVGRPGGVQHVEVGLERAGQGAVRRLDDDERHAGQLPLPAVAKGLGVLGVLGDEDRPDVLGDRPPDVHRLDDRPSDPGDRDDDPFLALRAGEDEIPTDRELPPRRVVLELDEQHRPDDQGNEDHDEVGAVGELHRGDDDEHDGGQDRAKAVDRRPPPPATLPVAGPVADHPDLRQREAHEHPDRVERDQRVGVPAEEHEQRGRDRGEEHDPVAEREPVAAEGELARDVAVDREQRGQPRERVEARVRGEEQDQRRAGLEKVEQR